MKRAMTAAVAALVVSGLAACGSSGGSTASTPSGQPTSTHSSSHATAHPASASPTSSKAATPTPTVNATAISESTRWSHSVCSVLNADEVTKTVKGLPKKQGRHAHSEVGYLTTDDCQFDVVTSSEFGDSVLYGLSARPWTVPEWQDLVKNSLQGDDTLKSVKLGAHGALVDDSSGWVLVGDRVLTVMGPFKATSAAQVTALLKLALPKVASVQPLPALIGLPECGKVDAEAAAVIGGPATVRRDEKLDGDNGALCGWARSGGSVNVEPQRTENAEQLVRDEVPRVKDAQPIKGLGVAAVYFPSGAQLDVATKDSKITIYSSGSHTNKERLVALARAMLRNQ